jgi:bifunctional DNA-binding transcriptional regulator/antitoxin component of YhaV-PrlF toxin-antitoxin module
VRLELKEGDKVYLFRKNVKIKRLSDKLNYKKLRLFKINKKIKFMNYKLKLLKIIKIHLIFHMSLLKLTLLSALVTLIIKV